MGIFGDEKIKTSPPRLSKCRKRFIGCWWKRGSILSEWRERNNDCRRELLESEERLTKSVD
jgi:hypothetical protein